MTETFKEKVCRHFDIPLESYDETVLRLTLYPHARWLPQFEANEWLAVDRDFVAEVGRLTRWGGFSELALDFEREPQNRLFRRRSLRLRVSVHRMRVLFSEMWGESVPTRTRQAPGRSGGESFRAARGHPLEKERQLLETEELLRMARQHASVLETLDVGVMISDIDGRICQTNDTVLRILKSVDQAKDDSYG
jgi:PAS domain-containing protein